MTRPLSLIRRNSPGPPAQTGAIANFPSVAPLIPQIRAVPGQPDGERAIVSRDPHPVIDGIYEGPDMLYIHPEECIDCGACEPECPVTAIFPEEDVLEEWASHIKKNYEYFEGGERTRRRPGARQLAQTSLLRLGPR